MSEEEKETIEDCKELVQELKQHKYKFSDFIGRLYYKSKPVEDILSVLLNLIENQQKELNNLKEIEQAHKADNGLLRQELDMQIEHNKELDNILYAKQSMIDELTQNEEKLKIELGKEKEKNNNLIKQLQEQNTEIQDISRQLRQEKEKNKELEEKLKIATAMLTKGTYPEKNKGDNDFDKQFIAVDKIKDKIKENKKLLDECDNGDIRKILHDEIRILKEMLEEKQNV